MYDLAEECFRWLGDIRGLADTLDFYGFAYEEKRKWLMEGKDCDNKKLLAEIYGYMAKNKWTQSELLWKKIGAQEKLENTRNEKEEIIIND